MVDKVDKVGKVDKDNMDKVDKDNMDKVDKSNLLTSAATPLSNSFL